MSAPVYIRGCADGVMIDLHVVPRASKTRGCGAHGDRWKVQVAAPPVDGAANDAVVAYLSEVLDVTRGEVRIVAGATGRRKTVSIHGVSLEHVAGRLRDA